MITNMVALSTDDALSMDSRVFAPPCSFFIRNLAYGIFSWNLSALRILIIVIVIIVVIVVILVIILVFILVIILVIPINYSVIISNLLAVHVSEFILDTPQDPDSAHDL